MRILVTGGDGFVGRPLVRMLVPDHEVTVVDSLRYGQLRFTTEELERFQLERVDIRDADSVGSVITDRDPEVIIHLAAIHYIPECQADPPAAVATNVGGTVNLLKHCPPGTRFVFASSGAVYRASQEPLVEGASPLRPGDVYGTTKLHAEDYVAYFAGLTGFPAVNVRLFNVVGPGETNPHILPEIVAQLKAGKRRLSLGNITPRRDFVHVVDAARGFAAAALQGSVAAGSTEVVNLGRGRAHSVQDLLDLLAQIIGEEISVDPDPARFRRVDNPLMLADIRKIDELFGWRPTLDIHDAASDLWKDPDLPPGLMEQYLA